MQVNTNLGKSTRSDQVEQESIPVGSVPSAAVAVCLWGLPGGCLLGWVSAQGHVCPGGVSAHGGVCPLVSAQGVSAWGVSAQGVSAQGGVCPGDVCVSQHALRQTPLHEQND